MKVLLLNRSLDGEIASNTPDQNNGSCSEDVLVIPDSALVTRNRPVFLPFENGNFSAQALVAYRIGRLGKNVAAKFAYRYIDAVAPCCLLRVEGSKTPNLDCCLDGSLALGQWIEIYAEGQVGDADQNLLQRNVRLRFFVENTNRSADASNVEAAANPEVEELELEGGAIKVGQVVKYLSRATTLKTGDIIIPAVFTVGRKVAIGSEASVSVDVEGLGSSDLRFRYK